MKTAVLAFALLATLVMALDTSSVPSPPSGSVVSAATAIWENGQTVVYATSAPWNEVLSFYTTELPKAGWKISDTDGGRSGELSAYGPDGSYLDIDEENGKIYVCVWPSKPRSNEDCRDDMGGMSSMPGMAMPSFVDNDDRDNDDGSD